MLTNQIYLARAFFFFLYSASTEWFVYDNDKQIKWSFDESLWHYPDSQYTYIISMTSMVQWTLYWCNHKVTVKSCMFSISNSCMVTSEYLPQRYISFSVKFFSLDVILLQNRDKFIILIYHGSRQLEGFRFNRMKHI